MASPHVCGLLAYYVSLQPASDSAYAVTEITPKQLKDQMISIATKGVLSDMPAGTPNCKSALHVVASMLTDCLVLAWNGGGSSNYTEIINDGRSGSGVEKSSSLKAEFLKLAAELEQLIAKS